MIETVFAVLVGLFLAAAIYLLLSRALIRLLLGIVLLGNAINLMIFVAGRLPRAAATNIPAGATLPAGSYANPLPQALILTAIVIGFATFAFLSVLALRAYQELSADNTDDMRLAEPEPHAPTTLEY